MIDFRCHRCLLVVRMEEYDVFDLPGLRPTGWETVQASPVAFRFVWRCPACVREVAAGSPEEL